MTAGTLLLDAAAKAGLLRPDGAHQRPADPRRRGGGAGAPRRRARSHALDDRFDLLLAIDWQNVNRFADEIPLAATSVMIGDPDEGEPPDVFQRDAARATCRCRSRRRRRASPGSWTNMVALGRRRRARRHSRGGARGRAARHRGSATAEALEANLAALRAGHRRRRRHRRRAAASRRSRHGGGKRWLISGNEAAGYGAIRGGVRFVAAYPITPATELLEWMAPALAKVGGTLLQAEDELASINMIIGASYGGVPSLTATAGPGPRADDRGHRARGQRRGADRRRRRDARRPVDRHPGEERAERPVVRGQRPARRRAAARARADVDRRLPRDDAMGGRARRGAAGAGDRAVRPVHGPVARDHRPARRRRASSASA